MKHLLTFSVLLLLPGFRIVGFALPAGDRPMSGFGAPHAGEQRALEARFDSSLRREDYRVWMKRIAARPHNLGSPYGKENAEFIKSMFSSWGFDAHIEEFNVLFPTPKTRVLELTEPAVFRAQLAEPPLREDSTSAETAEQLPTYNAYSVDGDVTGELVYVNYGVPDDYDVLARNGVDVRGRIVIARYGGAWRGIKPKVAAEHGAIGCIIYSDPRDDGYYDGDVYPKGSFRSDEGVQRGSVADMPLYPGDPLTPFVGATKDAKRLKISEAQTLTKIPVLPISYGDAIPFLRALGGPVAPDDWRGALPLTYHLGPGPAKAHLKVEFSWNTVPARDVIATLRGNERPDEWIVRGNHYDAWVNGAVDPVSGLVSMMEEARGIGQLLASGWKPKRTIVYCAWDGEEPGLLGSTEWVEAHADLLKAKGAAYINSDSNGRGYAFAGGSHTLEKFVNEVLRDVTDPEKNISVEDRARDRLLIEGSPDDQKDARERADLRIYPMGSGSDYTPFLQHLGIASLNVGYGGEDDGGSYHSIYDSYDYFRRFVDSTYRYCQTLSQTTGRLVLRLADADVLPLDFNDFTETVSRYVADVMKQADDMRDATVTTNQEISTGVFANVADPWKTILPPPRKDPVPFIDFAPLQNAMTMLKESASGYDSAMKGVTLPLSESRERTLDEILMNAERALTDSRGLPRRPWFVHEIYAPGFYTGYGVKTLPGIREAIEQRRWDEANEQVTIVSAAIERFAKAIVKARGIFSAGAGE